MQRLTVLFVLLAGVLAACGGGNLETMAAPKAPAASSVTTAAPGTAASAPGIAGDNATSEQTETDGAALAKVAGIVGNLTYAGLFPDQTITLSAGYGPYEDESPGQPYVLMIDQLIATGDLNGDGSEDAVTFLVDNSTGSADFVYLVAVLNVGAKPMPVEALMIGDRTPVLSLSIEDSRVIVEFIAPGPNDVACCPSQNVRKVFQLKVDRLVESESEDLGTVSVQDLNGTSWRLVDLNLDQEPLLPETEITLNFADGQISGSAGCNDYNGTIVSSAGDLPQTLLTGPISATRMQCANPIAVQETEYLARLTNAVAWRYDFGYLSLAYKLNDNTLGELLYSPQGQ